MVQIIDKSNEDTFGRLGRAFGSGLAEQVPKEVDRYRLSKGLQNFEKESANLNPMQQLARLSSIPGITPQMIQSFSELSKHQNVRNAYAKKAGEKARPSVTNEQGGPSLKDVKFGNFTNDNQTRAPNAPGKNDTIVDESKPPINDRNPTRESAIPRAPWSNERRQSEIAQTFEDFPTSTLQEAQAMVADKEARELAQPIAEQQKDTHQDTIQKDLYDRFNNQLETKLEKKLTKDAQGNEVSVYKDITGENLVNLQRGMERDLRANPNANKDDIVNKWTTKALDLAKAKSQLSTLSSGNFLSKIFSNEKYQGKLDQYQKIFSDSGNSEEFSNILKGEDFSMSPAAANSVAYPLNKQLKTYVGKQKAGSVDPIKSAMEVEKYLTPSDSIQSILWNLRSKDRLFDQEAFLSQLRRDQDEIGLTQRQRRELAEGTSDILPSWGDIVYLPLFGG